MEMPKKKDKKPTPSTIGSKKMYRSGKLVDKGSYGQNPDRFKAPRVGVDKQRELYRKSMKTGTSGTDPVPGYNNIFRKAIRNGRKTEWNNWVEKNKKKK